MKKTEPVRVLVVAALARISLVRSSVIGDVFEAIAKSPQLLAMREAVIFELGERVVNQWTAKYTSQETGWVSSRHRLKTANRLIKSRTYAELIPSSTR